MLAKVFSVAFVGLKTVLVEVEVDIFPHSLPSFTIVGLPGKAVEESRERVRSAIKNIAAKFPAHRIIVNLTPADLPKDGPLYDLPIALGVLIASGQLKANTNDAIFLGELSLDGRLKSTKGALPAALLAQKQGIAELFLPKANSQEAAVVRGVGSYPVNSLRELVEHLSDRKKITPNHLVSFNKLKAGHKTFDFDLSEIVGQESAKRALEIAAAGNHNLYMFGPPGAGKTLLARTLPSILPTMVEKEAIELTRIYSIAGQMAGYQSLVSTRPFRSPHHTISRIGLVGGGSKPKPGEVSLAHRGVLFLDEFPEFPRNVLEALRQPVEDGVVQITRVLGTYIFPSRFLLIAASNPCPCGYYGSYKRECHCSSGQIARYQKRISGPIIDRIDLHIAVPEVKTERLIAASQSRQKNSDTSLIVRHRVQKARDIQSKRFAKLKTTVFSNGELSSKQVKELCPLDIPSLKVLQQAIDRMGLSARSYFKIIKVARTIADLEGVANIATRHVAESLQYRLSIGLG